MTTRERLETAAELLEGVAGVLEAIGEQVRMLAAEIPAPEMAQEFADAVDCAARPLMEAFSRDGRRASGGSNVATYRKARHMTQAELAAIIGVKRSTLAMWETGKVMPPTKYLVAIAEALGCTVDELLKPESA